MYESISFINKTIIKSPFQLLFSFILPLIIMVIGTLVWSFLINLESSIYTISIFPCLSMSSIICINILSVPIIIYEYKNRGFFERVTTTKLPTNGFIFYMFIYFATIMILFYFLVAVIGTLIISLFQKPETINELWATADWCGVLYTMFITSVLCGSFGLFIGNRCKKKVTIQIIAITILLISVFGCYFFIPIALLVNEPTDSVNMSIMLSYFWPLSYCSRMMTESWLQSDGFNCYGSTIFKLNVGFYSRLMDVSSYVIINSIWEKYLNIFIPNICILLLSSANFLLFKTKIKHNEENYEKK